MQGGTPTSGDEDDRGGEALCEDDDGGGRHDGLEQRALHCDGALAAPYLEH